MKMVLITLIFYKYLKVINILYNYLNNFHIEFIKIKKEILNHELEINTKFMLI